MKRAKEERLRRKELGLTNKREPSKFKKPKRPANAKPLHVERMLEKWKLEDISAKRTTRRRGAAPEKPSVSDSLDDSTNHAEKDVEMEVEPADEPEVENPEEEEDAFMDSPSEVKKKHKKVVSDDEEDVPIMSKVSCVPRRLTEADESSGGDYEDVDAKSDNEEYGAEIVMDGPEMQAEESDDDKPKRFNVRQRTSEWEDSDPGNTDSKLIGKKRKRPEEDGQEEAKEAVKEAKRSPKKINTPKSPVE